jgi:RNA-directed DNA polymerase
VTTAGYNVSAASLYVRDVQEKMRRAQRNRQGDALRTMQKEALGSFNFRLMAVQHVRRKVPGLRNETVQEALSDLWDSPVSPYRARLLQSPGRKKRTVYTPSHLDRIRQSHLLLVLRPILEHDAPSSIYNPVGRGWIYAVRDLALHLEGFGPQYFAKADLANFYSSLDLEAIVERLPLAEKLRAAIREQMMAPVHDQMGQQIPVTGLPQGANLSPGLAAVPLLELARDYLSKDKTLGTFAYVDDLVVLHPRLEVLVEQSHRLEQWTHENGVTLNPAKSYIGHSKELTPSIRDAPLPFTNHLMAEFPFLGFQFRHSSGIVQVDRHSLGRAFWEWFEAESRIDALRIAERRLEDRRSSVNRLRRLILRARPSSRIEVSLPFE